MRSIHLSCIAIASIFATHASAASYEDPDGTFSCAVTFGFSSQILQESRERQCLEGPRRKCAGSTGEFSVKGPEFQSKLFKTGGMGGGEVDYYNINEELKVAGSVRGNEPEFFVRFSYVHHREQQSTLREVHLGLEPAFQDRQTESQFKLNNGRGIVGTEINPGEELIHTLRNPQGIEVRGRYADQKLHKIEVRCRYNQ
jgi:hypothetical protein